MAEVKTPSKAIKDPKVAELTVSQLQRLIRKTVQQAVAEVIVEMSAIREMEDADLIEYEAELSEYLQGNLLSSTPMLTRKHDD